MLRGSLAAAQFFGKHSSLAIRTTHQRSLPARSGARACANLSTRALSLSPPLWFSHSPVLPSPILSLSGAPLLATHALQNSGAVKHDLGDPREANSMFHMPRSFATSHASVEGESIFGQLIASTWQGAAGRHGERAGLAVRRLAFCHPCDSASATMQTVRLLVLNSPLLPANRRTHIRRSPMWLFALGSP